MAIIRSEIAGLIWKIEVVVGGEVAKGQVMIILESMKMEIPLEATAAGRVTEVFVVQGQSVAEAEPVLRLEPL